MWRLEGEVGSSTWKSTQHDASIVVRVGDDGIHELVVRGGDAVEVDGHVVVGLERAIGVGAELSSDGEKGIVADVAEAGCFGAAVVMDLGPVVHKDQFVSVSAVGGARAGGAAGSAAGDAGMTKAEAPVHGDEPLSFRVGEREAVAAHDVGGRAGQPKGAGASGLVAFVDVADALDFVIERGGTGQCQDGTIRSAGRSSPGIGTGRIGGHGLAAGSC